MDLHLSLATKLEVAVAAWLAEDDEGNPAPEAESREALTATEDSILSNPATSLLGAALQLRLVVHRLTLGFEEDPAEWELIRTAMMSALAMIEAEGGIARDAFAGTAYLPAPLPPIH